MSTPGFFPQPPGNNDRPSPPLAVLATRVPWASIAATLAPMVERRARGLFGATAILAGSGPSAAGRPRLPIRFITGPLYLKQAATKATSRCVRAGLQFFCGDEYFQARVPCDPPNLFRHAFGEAGVEDLLPTPPNESDRLSARQPVAEGLLEGEDHGAFRFFLHGLNLFNMNHRLRQSGSISSVANTTKSEK